ncbi:MAG: hypothetical protein RL222_1273 [Bacteroidota bacterium]|jgi:hypothetical protein
MLQETKKIFISYSWKPYTHKLKVIELAERLTNDGIHVILDDWDLKEGQDKYHFMEQMVNDDSPAFVGVLHQQTTIPLWRRSSVG